MALVGLEIWELEGIELWPVMYDIDDDGQVSFGDLAFFATAFQQTVGEPDTPFAWGSDFDHSGRVDVGDLAFFAENFQRVPGSPIIYPANFPEAWRAGTASGGWSAVIRGPASARFGSEPAPVLPQVISESSSSTGPIVVDATGDKSARTVGLPDGVWLRAAIATMPSDPFAAVDAWPGAIPEAGTSGFLQPCATDELMASFGSSARRRTDLLGTSADEAASIAGYLPPRVDHAVGGTLSSEAWDTLAEGLTGSVGESELDRLSAQPDLDEDMLDELFAWWGRRKARG
jgi:hypothetical protein